MAVRWIGLARLVLILILKVLLLLFHSGSSSRYNICSSSHHSLHVQLTWIPIRQSVVLKVLSLVDSFSYTHILSKAHYSFSITTIKLHPTIPIHSYHFPLLLHYLLHPPHWRCFCLDSIHSQFRFFRDIIVIRCSSSIKFYSHHIIQSSWYYTMVSTGGNVAD